MTRPTHMLADGSAVYPDGYDPADLSPLPEGYWEALDFATAKAAAFARVSASFYAVLAQGCASPKGWVDCDDKAQSRVTSAVSLMRETTDLGMAPPPVSWTMYDKAAMPHTLTELVMLGIAIGMRTQVLFAAKQQMEAVIGAATSVAELDAIDIEGGWPA